MAKGKRTKNSKKRPRGVEATGQISDRDTHQDSSDATKQPNRQRTAPRASLEKQAAASRAERNTPRTTPKRRRRTEAEVMTHQEEQQNLKDERETDPEGGQAGLARLPAAENEGRCTDQLKGQSDDDAQPAAKGASLKAAPTSSPLGMSGSDSRSSSSSGSSSSSSGSSSSSASGHDVARLRTDTDRGVESTAGLSKDPPSRTAGGSGTATATQRPTDVDEANSINRGSFLVTRSYRTYVVHQVEPNAVRHR